MIFGKPVLDTMNKQHMPAKRPPPSEPVATIAQDPRILEGFPGTGLLMATIKESLTLGTELTHEPV